MNVVEGWKALANRHVQIVLTPQEYQQITEPYYRGSSLAPAFAGDDYWSRMPRYLVGRCPICAAIWVTVLDTYSLGGWADFKDGLKISYGKQEIGCRHSVAIQNFVNLHGHWPEELGRYSNKNSEIPFVMPIFLPDDVESYAVIHAVPVCRVERGQFVPRYSTFVLTYYSTAPREVVRRRKEKLSPHHWGEALMFTARRARRIPEAWDLPDWVEKGKLLWLDLTRDDLPLKAGPVEEFPYGEIEGIRDEHIYHRDGRLQVLR